MSAHYIPVNVILFSNMNEELVLNEVHISVPFLYLSKMILNPKSYDFATEKLLFISFIQIDKLRVNDPG